jgi:hypothetical protein
MFKFDRWIPAEGFQWANRRRYSELGTTVRGRADRFLVAVASTRRPQSYDVFSNGALFRIFTETPATEDGVLQFANRYGHLGGHCLRRISEPDPVKPNLFWPGHGELLSEWTTELGLMRHAVLDLWDNIRTGDTLRLKPYITWEKSIVGFRVHYTCPELAGRKRTAFVIADQREDKPFTQIRNGDILRPAWLALLRIITVHSRRFPLNGVLTDRSTAKEDSAEFSISADSLLGAMWIQFARAVANNPDFRRCAQCGDEFEITTDKRADAKFCSPTCRLRAYRKRVKQQARRGTSRRKNK